MLSMPPLIFPGYTLLKEAVNKHDYSFYPLIRNSSIVEPYTWDEVSRKEAEVLYYWETYLILPRPREHLSMSFRDAGISGYLPHLDLGREDLDKKVKVHNGYHFEDHSFYFLTHLILKDQEAVAMGHPFAFPPYSSKVTMSLDQVVPLFSRCFGLAKFDEEGKPSFKVPGHLN